MPAQTTLLNSGRMPRKVPGFNVLIALLFVAFSTVNACAEACFDDENLAQLQSASAAHRGTLIYVWSPRMVYSVQNMAVASRAAAVAGLDFVVIRDGAAAPAEADPAAWTYRPQAQYPSAPERNPPADLATPPVVPLQDFSQMLCSPRLISLDAQRHFPTAFVVSSGQIHRFPIVGAMPYEAWAISITKRLNDRSSAK